MYAALQEAETALSKNEVPIGAVVVYNNRIIGKGHNQVESLKDPTAHAEMLAITAASNNLGDKFLLECDLYVTVEPCLMCTGAIINSRITRLFFGSFEPKFGSCGSIYNIPDQKLFNHHVKVFSGLLSNESESLMTVFFRSLRSPNN